MDKHSGNEEAQENSREASSEDDSASKSDLLLALAEESLPETLPPNLKSHVDRVARRELDSGPRDPSVRKPIRSVRILAVDDEPDVRELVAAILRGAGFACDVASGGEEAVALCKQNAYNVVITDLQMPDMSGLDVAQAIRNQSSSTRVIVLTGHGDLESARQAVRVRVDDYLLKPLDEKEVLASVERALVREDAMRDVVLTCQQMSRELSNVKLRLQRRFLGGIVSLATALEARDPYTKGHSSRVANMAVEVACRLDFSGEQLDEFAVGALLHDVGKIAVSDTVLLKKKSLSEDEFDRIRQHPRAGYHILSPFFGTSDVTECALYHHERWDGNGYPEGLTEAHTPLVARIIAVCDAFDAMTSKRPYRPAMPTATALTEVRQGHRTQFDPEIADLFMTTVSQQAAQ